MAVEHTNPEEMKINGKRTVQHNIMYIYTVVHTVVLNAVYTVVTYLFI